MSKSIIAVSALAGAAAALAVCFGFFYFIYKPALRVDAQPTETPTPRVAPTPFSEIPNPEIKASDVSSVTISTVYNGYFEPAHKCAKTYNEYFGNEDGISSSSSPCRIVITFSRDGKASRSIHISRWDKAAKEKRVVESSFETSQITAEQFDEIASGIVSNQAFRSWRDGTMLTVSNCTISVEYAGGKRSPMSNVDEKTTAYLPLVEAFRSLEKKLAWQKATEPAA